MRGLYFTRRNPYLVSMRVVAMLLLGLVAMGCASASDPAPAPASTDCDGAAWEDISAGKVACEHLDQDQCAFSDQQKPVAIDSADAHWVCTCGHDIHLYWCESR